MRSYLVRCLVVVVVPVGFLLLMASVAGGSTPPGSRYLLVGGGSSPYNTQVSLEEHLSRFRTILRAEGVAAPKLLFADGARSHPVVVLRDEQPPPDGLEADLALVLGRSDDRALTWRPSKLPGIDGPATKGALREALLAAPHGERTLFYFAGHGNREKHGRFSMGLWGDERLYDRELVHWLDRLPPEHRFVGVFTQCHSGGFGSLLFQHGDSNRGLSSHDRCAFFAAPADRLASGCTPEANRKEPDDYSTWFLTALTGRLPDGKRAPSTADYDGDGRVSLSEAHAFARIHDRTINVPVSTSELLLADAIGRFEKWDELSLASPFPAIVDRARPAERLVLESLADSVGLKGDSAAALKARYEADRLDSERTRLEGELRALTAQREQVRSQLRKSILDRWPWLQNPWHPKVEEILSADRGAMERMLRGSSTWRELQRRSSEVATVRSRLDATERQWARWERLARAAEAVVREAHLRAAGSPEQVARLDAVLRCEAEHI